MMVKSAQPGVGGGYTASTSPFIISTVTYKVVVYIPAERADRLPLYLLYPYMLSVDRAVGGGGGGELQGLGM